MFRSNRTGEPSSDGPGLRWYLAAGFAGFVVVALVLVLTLGGGTSPEPAPKLPPAAAGGKSGDRQADPDPNRPPGCHTTATDQTVPRSASQLPNNIEWHLVNGTAYPTSPTAGPMLHDGAATFCYARNPVGALLAAWNIPQGVRSGVDAAQQMAQIAKHSLVPNKYARQLQRMVRSSSQQQASGESDEGQIAGYRFVSYTPQVATIALATQFVGHQGQYQVQVVTLRWHQGDWRYVIQKGPRLAGTVSYPDSLANFVPFSGVS